MQEQYIEALKEYGLSENEIVIYITALKMGEATAQAIAKQAGLPRTTTYHLLDSLVQKGLVSSIEKGVIKHFQATPPGQLVEMLTEKKRHIEDALPELKAIAATIKERPRAVIYEGLQGIRAILQDILEEKKEILHYGDLASLQNVLRFAFPQFIRQRVEKKIPIRAIGKKEEPHQELLRTAKKEYRQFVFIPKEYAFKTNVFIYANKVAILNLHSEPYYGLIVSNKEYYETEKNLFELLWKAYKK